jgi:hypothetical protein
MNIYISIYQNNFFTQGIRETITGRGRRIFAAFGSDYDFSRMFYGSDGIKSAFGDIFDLVAYDLLTSQLLPF